MKHSHSAMLPTMIAAAMAMGGGFGPDVLNGGTMEFGLPGRTRPREEPLVPHSRLEEVRVAGSQETWDKAQAKRARRAARKAGFSPKTQVTRDPSDWRFGKAVPSEFKYKEQNTVHERAKRGLRPGQEQPELLAEMLEADAKLDAKETIPNSEIPLDQASTL